MHSRWWILVYLEVNNQQQQYTKSKLNSGRRLVHVRHIPTVPDTSALDLCCVAQMKLSSRLTHINVATHWNDFSFIRHLEYLEMSVSVRGYHIFSSPEDRRYPAQTAHVLPEPWPSSAQTHEVGALYNSSVCFVPQASFCVCAHACVFFPE